jgi:hypothetical protein
MTGIMFITGIIVAACAILGGMYLLIRETQQPARERPLQRTPTGNWK